MRKSWRKTATGIFTVTIRIFVAGTVSQCTSHPKFDDPGRVEELQRELYRQDFERLGPSPLRLARVWLNGFRTFQNDANPLLAARAEMQRRRARGVLPLTRTVERFGLSATAKREARALREDLIRFTGEETATERAAAELTTPLYAATRMFDTAGIFQQPGLLRTEHRTGNSEASTRDCFQLQGAPFRRPLGALAEDAVAKFAGPVGRIFGDRRSREVFEAVTRQAAALPASWGDR
ncbi:MAG: hypothetical protein M5R36_07415 [Deltaproteobacteria bacterium]|nr:hypothetical protein [Deltaproteobacteria bacterium]